MPSTDNEVGEGFRWIEVAPVGAYTVIALVPPMSNEDPQPGGRAPFGFDTPNLEAAMAEFSSRGVEFEDVRGGESGPMPPGSTGGRLARRRWAAVIDSHLQARMTAAVKLRTMTAEVDPLAMPANAARKRAPTAMENAPSRRSPEV